MHHNPKESATQEDTAVIPVDNRLRDLLKADDAASLPYRERRLAFILDLHGPDSYFAFPGGLLSGRAFEEARRTFLDGSSLASILLVQVCIEKALVGMGRAAGDNVEKLSGFGKLLTHAVKKRLLTADEVSRLNRLRFPLNQYTHGRAPLDPEGVESRALKESTTPEAVLAKDAEDAIRILYAFVERLRFN